MKKDSRTLVAVAILFAMVFAVLVSCRAEADVEEMLPQGVVGVSVEIDQEKSIMMWVEDDVTSYEYRAVPQFDLAEENYNDGIFGEQQTWRVVTVSNYKASLGYYRQGRWIFYLRAKNRNGEVVMTGESDPVYLRKGLDNVVRITLQYDDDRGADGRNLNTGKIAFGFETNMLDWTATDIEHAYIRLEASKLNSTGGIDAVDEVYTIPLKALSYMGAGTDGFVSMLPENTALDGMQDGRTDHEGQPGNASHVPGSSTVYDNAPSSDTAFIASYMSLNPNGNEGQTAMGFMKDIVRYTVGSEVVTGLYSQVPVQYKYQGETLINPRCYVPDGATEITELYTLEYVYEDEVPQGRVRFYAETPDLVWGTVTAVYEGQSQQVNAWTGGVPAGQYLVRVLLCERNEATDGEIIIAGQVLAVKVVGGETTTVWGTLVPEKYIPSALAITVAADVDGFLNGNQVFQLTTNTLSSVSIRLTYTGETNSDLTNAVYRWYVDGELQSEARSQSFTFVPSRYGDAKITCYVYDTVGDGSFGKQASATQVINVMPATGNNL